MPDVLVEKAFKYAIVQMMASVSCQWFAPPCDWEVKVLPYYAIVLLWQVTGLEDGRRDLISIQIVWLELSVSIDSDSRGRKGNSRVPQILQHPVTHTRTNRPDFT
ncbi:hypothetical protein E2C01_102806 [Portunus trituberculatus]|uniref:Uncharacterized protein n=1 Tax=Portunus trituberculatus TaxID=210409 RepID=A0A5B7KJE8_PORTR|nr:hypothetical protein [Portunus trituberculatus]